MAKSIDSTLDGLDNLIESKEPITGWTIDDEEEEGESGDWIGFWIRDMIGSNSLHKRDDKTWRDLEKMGKREGVHVTRADFDEYLNNTAYEKYLDGHGWRDLWKDWVKDKDDLTLYQGQTKKSDWYSYAISEGLTRAEAKAVWDNYASDSFGETGTETHYKYQRRHYIEIGNKLKNLPKDQKQQEFKKWDEIFRADNERYDSQRFADHIGLFEVDSVTETLHALDNLIEAEVLQSASGSLSPQKRNKAIRALQSIPRNQTLGKSDVIPNIDTALEQLDTLIEAKIHAKECPRCQMEGDIDEALKQLSGAEDRYYADGQRSARVELMNVINWFEPLLKKCQDKIRPHSRRGTIGTRPVHAGRMKDMSESDLRERITYLKSEFTKCKQECQKLQLPGCPQ